MLSLVLDCSVAMAWCFEDEARPATDAILDRVAEEGAQVPSLWFLEVGNVLIVAERRGRIEQAQVGEFLGLLGSLPIATDRSEASIAFVSVLPLARQLGLSCYDAAYLELAQRTGVGLATLDERLSRAAGLIGVDLLLGL
ncbi:MAG: type II toxin-antitoxin system VapC family toxin [Candidatus Eremiobacteraeota bacterium]|nr:type II toxin-antitoxin system VapC family toxin [Candidatus Eremiobacteraeota bacterium]